VADDAWQSAWVEVLPDFSDFRNKANPQITTILSGAGTSGALAAGASMGAVFGGSFFGTILADLGIRLTSSILNGIQRGVEAGLDFIGQSVAIASDLNESVNALNKSFGDLASGGIQALGESAATSLGISNREFNQLSVRFSGFARQIVGEGGDLVGFIDDLTKRGADFASVYNIEVADALGLFQSGLAGETEPLMRAAGIDLRVAAVSAHAYAVGIAEVGTELTGQQQLLARYSLLMQETEKTQGDFQDTSRELANQQRILASEFQNAQGRLGTALLPAMTELANLANDELVPILNQTIEEIGPLLAEALTESVPLISEMVTAIAPLIPDLVKLSVELLPPFISLLIAASPALIELAESMASGAENLNALLAVFEGTGSIEDFFATVSQSSGALVEFQAAVLGTIHDVSTSLNSFFDDAGTWLVDSGRALIQGFINGITQMTKPLGDAVSGVLEWAAGFFPHSPAERGPFAGKGWTDVLDGGAALINQFEAGFRPIEIPFGGASGAGPSRFASLATPGNVSVSLAGAALTLMVDGRPMRAYIQEGASAVVRSASDDRALDFGTGGVA
jgi:hypothetical protein